MLDTLGRGGGGGVEKDSEMAERLTSAGDINSLQIKGDSSEYI